MSSPARATTNELSQLAVTGWRAFTPDPVVRWFFPDDDDYEANGRDMFAWVLRRGLALDTVWATPGSTAFARWTPPGRPEPDVDDGPSADEPDWRLARYIAYKEITDQHAPTEDHWYLNMLATHPDWQRRGYGAALMGCVFAIADAEGLGCYLETETAENVAYYRRHGFDVRSEWDLRANDGRSDTGPHQWGMWRPPR